MTSEQGLCVYGAATWGQFFIYQGFNAHNGWMHTSYGGDAIDEYAETIVDTPRGRYYQYGAGLRKIKVSHITLDVTRGRPHESRVISPFTAVITGRSCAPRAANGSPSNC